MSALTILDRYLDEPIDDSLMAGLQDSDSVALRSLNELIAAMTADETAVIEYLVQLATQPPEVLGILLDAVPRLPPHPYLVTLLRMIAQGESPSEARTAIEQLGRLRMPEALSALDALTMTLPPALTALAERSARKLRMSGVRGAEPQVDREAATWRALISPVDGAGVQVVWFIRRAAEQDAGTLLTVITRVTPKVSQCASDQTRCRSNTCRPTNHSETSTVLPKTRQSQIFSCWRLNLTLAATWCGLRWSGIGSPGHRLRWNIATSTHCSGTPARSVQPWRHRRRATTRRRRWPGCSTIRFSPAGFGETTRCSMPPAG